MDVKAYDFIEKYNACAKIKIELQKAGVNFYKTDSLDILQARLAYAQQQAEEERKGGLFGGLGGFIGGLASDILW